jgi:hypothetical protein
MKANAPGQFVWRPGGNQHDAVAPNGAVLLGLFLKPNRFACGEAHSGFVSIDGEVAYWARHGATATEALAKLWLALHAV